MVLFVVLLYLTACLLLGVRAGQGRRQDVQGFVAGNRSLGLVVMYFVTGASIFSAFAFLGGPGWAYSRGLACCYILAYGTLGMVPLYFVGPRAHRVGAAFGFVTQAEMVGARFGHRGLTVAMAAVSVAAIVPYLSIQMKGAGFVLEITSGGAIPAWLGAAGVYAVVAVYTLRSGVLGVGWTNTFQGLFMMVLAWGLGAYLPERLYGGIPEMFDRVQALRPELLRAPGLGADGSPWNYAEYGSAVLVSVIGFSAWPHLFMKVFGARDARTVQRTVLWFPTFHLFLIPLFIIGFCGVPFPVAPDQPDHILVHMLMNSGVPSWAIGLFCAGALAASMSSGDAMAHAAGAIAIRDGVTPLRSKPLEHPRAAVQGAIGAVLGAAYAVAVGYQGSLVSLLLSTYGAVVQFAPVLWATFFLRQRSGTWVFWGLCGGVVLTVAFTLWPETRPLPLHAGLYGVIFQCLWLAFGPRRSSASTEPFLAAAAGFAPGTGPGPAADQSSSPS